MSVYDAHPEPTEPTFAEIRMTKRRERTKALLVRGMTRQEIAATLDVSLRTVERYAAEIRQGLAESLCESDALAMASDIKSAYEVVRREIWGLYARLTKSDAATTAVKASLLKQFQGLIESEVAQMQKLGIVYQAPREVLIEHAAVAALRKVPESALAEIAELPQEEFMRQLALYVGEAQMSALIEPGDNGASAS